MVLFKKALGRDLLRDLLVGMGNQFLLVSGSSSKKQIIIHMAIRIKLEDKSKSIFERS